MVLLRVTERRSGPLTMDIEKVDEYLFTSQAKAESWLVDSGFVLGQLSCRVYEPGEFQWFHRESASKYPLHIIDAEIIPMEVDPVSTINYTLQLTHMEG